MSARTLVIGAGLARREGAIHLDRVALAGIDVVFDLDCIPFNALPFPPETFTEVVAEDVLEHVRELVPVVNDVWRVLKLNGDFHIRGPSCFHPEIVWADPTHRRAFAPRTFDNWDPSTHDGKHYGHYIHGGKYFFKVLRKQQVGVNFVYHLRKEIAQWETPTGSSK